MIGVVSDESLCPTRLILETALAINPTDLSINCFLRRTRQPILLGTCPGPSPPPSFTPNLLFISN